MTADMYGPPKDDDDADSEPDDDVHRFDSFVDRLEAEGGLDVRALVAEAAPDLDIEGVVFHYRGVRVPAYNGMFVREPVGSRDVPAFSLEVDAVGPRSTWAVFDVTLGWDWYLVQTDEAVVLAWMTDEEFAAEEATQFDSKREAVAAGQFSFGLFLYDGESWAERLEVIQATDSPALVQLPDGRTLVPDNQPDFYSLVESSPEAFRAGAGAPDYLGLLELEVSIDADAPGDGDDVPEPDGA